MIVYNIWLKMSNFADFFFLVFFVLQRAFFYLICTVSGCDGGTVSGCDGVQYLGVMILQIFYI
jgi:hypothetical protein